MGLNVEICRMSDGIVRVYRYPYDWEGDVSEYMWGDGGNYSCDCNRALFFARSGAEDDPDIECGDTAYVIRITDDSGKEVYRDGDWPEPTV